MTDYQAEHVVETRLSYAHMVGPSDYVLDSPYADRYFRELSPAWINYVAALNGIAPRPLGGAFSYLELGSGHGTSLAVHAASFPEATFHGVDLNAAHIETARALAADMSVTNVSLHRSSFDDVEARDEDRDDEYDRREGVVGPDTGPLSSS